MKLHPVEGGSRYGYYQYKYQKNVLILDKHKVLLCAIVKLIKSDKQITKPCFFLNEFFSFYEK